RTSPDPGRANAVPSPRRARRARNYACPRKDRCLLRIRAERSAAALALRRTLGERRADVAAQSAEPGEAARELAQPREERRSAGRGLRPGIDGNRDRVGREPTRSQR